MLFYKFINKILFICLFCLFISGICQAENKPFYNSIKFVQVSDVHFLDNAENRGSRMLKHSETLLQDAINQINAMKDVNFVVFTGDMIDTPRKTLLEKFAKTANQLEVPWFWTMGNHDVGGKFNKDSFLQTINQNHFFPQNKPYYSYKKENFLFIFMNGVVDDRITSNAFFTERELSWLENEIKANRDSYIVIFQHYPLIEPFISSSHQVLNSAKYLEILDKYDNISAVITGHYHCARVKTRNNVVHISSPALVQYPNAMRKITLESVDEYVLISLDFMPVTLENVRAESLQHTASVKLHSGSEQDRESLIILHKPISKIPEFL
ncbi:MAG TPA: metallophosphoesterase [Candidatus Gastranaerophilales bacterium]|nr:metallophosphoesterase [Candidatus Gastranaerophilales bacterium]